MAFLTRYSSRRKPRYIGARIPAELKDKLDAKHPSKGDVSRVIRALIQMYIKGDINELRFVDTV